MLRTIWESARLLADEELYASTTRRKIAIADHYHQTSLICRLPTSLFQSVFVPLLHQHDCLRLQETCRVFSVLFDDAHTWKALSILDLTHPSMRHTKTKSGRVSIIPAERHSAQVHRIVSQGRFQLVPRVKLCIIPRVLITDTGRDAIIHFFSERKHPLQGLLLSDMSHWDDMDESPPVWSSRALQDLSLLSGLQELHLNVMNDVSILKFLLHPPTTIGTTTSSTRSRAASSTTNTLSILHLNMSMLTRSHETNLRRLFPGDSSSTSSGRSSSSKNGGCPSLRVLGIAHYEYLTVKTLQGIFNSCVNLQELILRDVAWHGELQTCIDDCKPAGCVLLSQLK